MRYLYDVCNDYSLSLCKDQSNLSPSGYGWITRHIMGEKLRLGYHKKYDELHYAISEKDTLDNFNLGGY